MTGVATKPGRARLHGLATALLLGVALALLSYVRRIGDMNSAMFRTGVMDSLLTGHFWGTALARHVLLFVAALLLLHLLFGLLCWCLARASEQAWPRARSSRLQCVWLWASVLAFALLLHNAAAFPGSSLGAPYATLASSRWLGARLADLLAGAVVLAALMTLTMALWRAATMLARPRTLGIAAAGICLAFLIVAGGVGVTKPPVARTVRARPNVILIGIDSLRDDLVLLDGSSQYAPNIARFLQRSTRFSDAITPLARTYPSWLSILTGQHPHTTGGVLNLLPRDMVHDGDTLGFVLRRAGYRTAYGIDEARFSNIDASYGFDQVITPPIGASEFMIAWFGDTPLSNAVVNTRLGQYLFPYLHANRGAGTIYDPGAYIRRMARELRTDERPLFLALHLTLAHWPYVWKDSAEMESNSDASNYQQYLRAVQRVDAQFAALVTLLRERGLLDNAIVVVLSDHGESFVPGSDSIGPVDSSVLRALDAVPGWGHGTSVLAPDQFRVVLGVRLPGSTGLAAAGRTIDAPVSVEDINPTVCALLGIAPSTRADGRSLLPLLTGSDTTVANFAERIRYTESEFTPKGVLDATNRLSTSGVASASRYYAIDPVTDRISVRRELVIALLEARQFAALSHQALVAAIPDPKGGGHDYVLLRDPFRQDGTVERLEGTPQEARDPEVRRLWLSLQAKFARTLAPHTPEAPAVAGAATTPRVPQPDRS